MLMGLFNRGSLPVLEQVMNFTEARQAVLADNVSNFDTVGYRVKDLPKHEFLAALNQAVQRRDRQGADAALEMKDTRNLHWDRQGRLQAQPVELRENNILFHDDNNRFVEKQMTEMSKNAILHNVSVELLRGQYNGLQSAIRGRL